MLSEYCWQSHHWLNSIGKEIVFATESVFFFFKFITLTLIFFDVRRELSNNKESLKNIFFKIERTKIYFCKLSSHLKIMFIFLFVSLFCEFDFSLWSALYAFSLTIFYICSSLTNFKEYEYSKARF